MTHIIFALLQLVLIPDLAKIVYDFVPDIECEYADGSTRCFKNGDTVDFTDVVHITVFTEFIITKDTKFNLLVDITGPVKLVGDMTRKFDNCRSFNSNTDLWDTSKCTNMSGMFEECVSFNQSLRSFDTSNCTDMAGMFSSCYLFNQSLRNFDTSNCTDMRGMFFSCKLFNSPCGLASFDTTQCTNMSYMFFECESFNPPGGLYSFDTLCCTSMRGMFEECVSFNQPLCFDTSNCTDMAYMFAWCVSFKQTIYFDMSNCDSLSDMLFGSMGEVIHTVRIITTYRRYKNSIVSAITAIAIRYYSNFVQCF
jgi:hypothetical protein